MGKTQKREGNKARPVGFLGTHLLLELEDCDPKILKNLDKIKDVMVSAAKKAKATIIDVSFNEFSPFRISGMVIIAESHLSIHTWLDNYAAVDIFTCGNVIKPEVAANYLVKALGSKKHSFKKINRGIFPIPKGKDTLPHKSA